jgi:low affinity Fe/Cu permease
MSEAFTRIASGVARWTGRPLTFLLCCAVIVVWGATGPLFNYSDTWQLIINTGTTIVTFLMVFLIQNTQNRDSTALQAKLDELILVTTQAKNEFIGIERLSDRELEEIVAQFERHRPEFLRRAQARAADDPGSPVQRSRKRASARAKSARRQARTAQGP